VLLRRWESRVLVAMAADLEKKQPRYPPAYVDLRNLPQLFQDAFFSDHKPLETNLCPVMP
jgi:hypothetical protein